MAPPSFAQRASAEGTGGAIAVKASARRIIL